MDAITKAKAALENSNSLLDDIGGETFWQAQEQVSENKAALAAIESEHTAAPVQTLTAEEYLRGKYGAYRGHHEWRALEEAFNAGKAAQAAPSVPEGWKLVPVNYTPEMRAAWDRAPQSEDDDRDFDGAYRAMIAAAPAAQAPDAKDAQRYRALRWLGTSGIDAKEALEPVLNKVFPIDEEGIPTAEDIDAVADGIVAAMQENGNTGGAK